MDDYLCRHAANKDVIFSVDTSYYCMQAIIQDMIDNPRRRHYHVIHVFNAMQGVMFEDGSNT